MIDKGQILKKVLKLDDKLIVSKILDKAFQAQNNWCVSHSDFLDPYQKGVIEKALAGNDDINYMFNGGYSGAEREVIIFCPDFIYGDYEESFEDEIEYPFKVIKIQLSSREKLSHRDYLGAIMGLGIKREKVGDILVKEDSCCVVALDDIAEYIKYNLTKVGISRVTTEIKDLDELQDYEPKVREINTTVASLRLDSVASAGFGISRSKIADFIRGEKVNLNWECTGSLTKQVKDGDTLSIKGKGRVVIESIGHTTRKGRIAIKLHKYI